MNIKLAEVLKPQGLKGEIKFRLLARSVDDIKSLNLILAGTAVTIKEIRESGGFLYIKFNELNSIQEAERFRGKFLEAKKEELDGFLAEGEYFIADLIDKSVEFETGEILGVLTDVSNYGSADVITVKKTDGKDVLLANVEGVIMKVTDTKVIFNKSKFCEVSV